MGQEIWCVTEKNLQDGLGKILSKWGFEPHFIDSPTLGKNDGFNSYLIDKDIKWLDIWARKIVSDLPGQNKDPLLFIQAELSETRAASRGIFLAELVWREKIVPTIVAALDPRAGQRSFSRRIRRQDRIPVIEINPSSVGIASKQAFLVLWDILSGQKEFENAVALACKRKLGPADLSNVKKDLNNNLIAEQIAFYRHQLGGLQASLRIMEGAYRQGWLSKSEVMGMLMELEKRANKKNNYLVNLNLIKENIEKFQPEAFYVKPSGNNELLIYVCDDEWKISGWNNTIPRIIKRLFNIDVIGTESVQQLEEQLSDKKRKNRIVTLLLDVHYNTENNIKTISKEFMQWLSNEYPLLDVVLFTSDLKLGWLVREAYRLNYRVFFKELDEQSRLPMRDASEFVKIVEDSVAAFPVRAIQNLAISGFVNIGDNKLISKMIQNLRSWRQSADPALSLALSPLLERQYRLCCETVTAQADDTSKKHIWNDLTKNNQLNLDLPASQLWKSIQHLATRSRNTLVHNPNVVLEANSALPSIGLAIPLIIGINSLHQICDDSFVDKLDDYLKNINLVFDALFMSNQITRSKTRTLLTEARMAFYSGQTKKEDELYAKIVEAVDDDDKNVFVMIGKTLKNKDAFYDPEIRFGGHGRTRINRNALRLYRRVCVLVTICLLDFNNNTLIYDDEDILASHDK